MPTDNNNPMMVDFCGPERTNSIIKVIGVGGGGGNAVNHMYREGIHDVSFVVCNTDNQALHQSPVPTKLQLGEEGLGAGNNPARARQAAEESRDKIKAMLSDNTKMAFITAGMGGGTGTGAAPVIAEVSKEMGILTVGIVTIPFVYEGKLKIDQALDGVEEISKHVDALLVINNERLREIYADRSCRAAFGKADDTLCVAAKSIAEIITRHGYINLDFNDVRTVLKDGGVAIMSTGYGEGEGRVKKAIEDALNSPLLNDNDVYHAKKILLNINYSDENEGDSESGGLLMEELTDIHDFMSQFDSDFEIKWGMGVDPSLGKKVKLTILASGFKITDVDGMDEHLGKQTQKDAEQRRLENEKEIERTIRRDKYYGPKQKNAISKKPLHLYFFSDEDLDNDNIILDVESTPTYKRTTRQLEVIRQKSVPKAAAQEAKKEEEKPIEIISFGGDDSFTPDKD